MQSSGIRLVSVWSTSYDIVDRRRQFVDGAIQASFRFVTVELVELLLLLVFLGRRVGFDARQANELCDTSLDVEFLVARGTDSVTVKSEWQGADPRCAYSSSSSFLPCALGTSSPSACTELYLLATAFCCPFRIACGR